MAGVLDQVAATPLGGLAFRLARPLVRYAGRVANNGISPDLKLTRVTYISRSYSIQHRRWSDTDRLAISQCFSQRQYNMPTGTHGAAIQRLYQDILAAGRQPLIIDCGANIGASVTWFAARYPQAHIVAIEPAPDNFALLHANCSSLDVDLRQAAIAASDGFANLVFNESPMAYHLGTESQRLSVQTTSLKTLLASKSAAHYVPFLIKIDVEEAERDLFCDDPAAFDSFPLIILEPDDCRFSRQLTSQRFFRFHPAASREFCMNHENVASIALDSKLAEISQSLKSSPSPRH